jgi:hypothetical protein
VRSSEPVSQAERAKLAALQARYKYLLAMLPNSVDDFDTDDADAFNARLADIEMIATEMTRVNDAQMAILDAAS